MTLEQEIAFWKRESENARTRDLALIAFGAYLALSKRAADDADTATRRAHQA